MRALPPQWTWQEVGAALALLPGDIGELCDEMNKRAAEDMIDRAAFVAAVAAQRWVSAQAEATRTSMLVWIHGVFAVGGYDAASDAAEAPIAAVEELATALSLFCSTVEPRAVCAAVFQIFDIDHCGYIHCEEVEVYVHALLRVQAALAGADVGAERHVQAHQETAQRVAAELFAALGDAERIGYDAFCDWFLGGVDAAASAAAAAPLSGSSSSGGGGGGGGGDEAAAFRAFGSFDPTAAGASSGAPVPAPRATRAPLWVRPKHRAATLARSSPPRGPRLPPPPPRAQFDAQARRARGYRAESMPRARPPPPRRGVGAVELQPDLNARFVRWQRCYAISALQVDELQERMVDVKVASRADPMRAEGEGGRGGVGAPCGRGGEAEVVLALREQLERWNRCKAQSLLRMQALQECLQ